MRYLLVAVAAAVAVASCAAAPAPRVESASPSSLGATSQIPVIQGDRFNSTQPVGQYTSSKPNIVVILTDDQRIDSLAGMAAVREHIQAKGVTFSNAHAPTSTCCPSRSSLLTGKLAQGTNVWTNWAPYGGFGAFYDYGNEESTIAVTLDEVGYRTALVGKYLNGYGEAEIRTAVTGENGYVPPGWDVWHAFAYSDSGGGYPKATAYQDYSMLHRTESYPAAFSWYGSSSASYSTNVVARLAVDTIATTDPSTPLFMLVTPYGPHAPYTTTPKYAKADVPNASYTPPGFANTKGKPSWVKAMPQVDKVKATNLRTRQMRALYPVDDAVDSIVDALARSGRLDNTLLVYASDNGYTWGEFNLAGVKNFPYTTPIPMLARWDGKFKAGSVDNRLVANVDVASTALAAAGVSNSHMSDAINLTSNSKRDSLVVSAWRNRGASSAGRMPAYCGLRTSKWLYVRYSTGFEELYDVATDKAMVNNVVDANRKEARVLASQTRKECSPTPPDFTW